MLKAAKECQQVSSDAPVPGGFCCADRAANRHAVRSQLPRERSKLSSVTRGSPWGERPPHCAAAVDLRHACTALW